MSKIYFKQNATACVKLIVDIKAEKRFKYELLGALFKLKYSLVLQNRCFNSLKNYDLNNCNIYNILKMFGFNLILRLLSYCRCFAQIPFNIRLTVG